MCEKPLYPGLLKRHFGPGILAVLGVALLAGCPMASISGTVVDVKGEALPGAVVTVVGSDWQATTDALGHYHVRLMPEKVTLVAAKTGYTEARQELDLSAGGKVEAKPIELWPLPQGQGVYLFEDYRYQPLPAMEAKKFPTLGQGVVYGLKYVPTLATSSAEPFLLCHKVSRNDLAVTRLTKQSIQLAELEKDAEPQEVYTGDTPISFELEPIDMPDQQLVRITFPRLPLEPGVYAVHWGALRGYTVTDKRLYLFAIESPETSQETAETDAPQPLSE